jgi:hypothetical protein
MTAQHTLDVDDLFLVSKFSDMELRRQSAYTAFNPLPYSIVMPGTLEGRSGNVYWPDRPAFWDTYDLNSGAVATPIQDESWSLEGIYRRWIEPLVTDEANPSQLRNCHKLATTLVFAEMLIDAFERFVFQNDYIVRWRPIYMPHENPVTSSNVANQRIFTTEIFMDALNSPEKLDWMRRVRDAQALEIQHRYKKLIVNPVPRTTRFTRLPVSSNISFFPINSDDGLIVGSVYTPTARF